MTPKTKLKHLIVDLEALDQEMNNSEDRDKLKKSIELLEDIDLYEEF